MPTHRASFFLTASARLRALTGEVQRLNALALVTSRVLPPTLAPAVGVKECRAGVLVLLAENAAVAAKLKQFAPRLLTTYRSEAPEITAIRVEVQVSRPAAPARRVAPKRSLGTENIKDLDRLAAALPESPLQRAVAAMASRHRKK